VSKAFSSWLCQCCFSYFQINYLTVQMVLYKISQLIKNNEIPNILAYGANNNNNNNNNNSRYWIRIVQGKIELHYSSFPVLNR
jgi:hypothetical protein